MAVRGVSRATADIDLLTVDTKVLNEELWSELKARGASLRLLRGDIDDPLAGSVRFSVPEDRIVVVVGRHDWQREIIESAEVLSIGDITLRVARPAGLVLLKLYAGGPKDGWDVRALLESHEAADAIKMEVDQLVSRLPSECATLWSPLREGSFSQVEADGLSDRSLSSHT
jgi:predicted nucleotidyltransferase